MNFGFTEEQEFLRAEVRKFLDQYAALEVVRKQVESPEGFSTELWRRMAELGWVGLTIPEAHGGVGMDLVTLVVLLEETGRSLFPSPLISTLLAAKAIELLGSDGQQARWLPALADGAKIGTLALLEESDRYDQQGVQVRGRREGERTLLSGAKVYVADVAAADLFVVAYRSGPGEEEISLAVLEKGAPGVSTKSYPAMDLTKRLGELSLENAAVGDDAVLGRAGKAWPTIAKLLDSGAVMVAAEMVGAAEGALYLTADYARQRVQFGAPIGRFQAVEHPLAEMYVDIESFKSLVYYAAWAVSEGAEDAPLAVSRAKAYASEAFARVGIDGGRWCMNTGNPLI